MQVVDARAVDTVLHGLLTVGRLLRQRGSHVALDPGTFWLLKTIADFGPMRVTDVAGFVNLDPSTVSRHVSQMQQSGLIDRTPDPDDGRAQLVAASTEGRQKLEVAFARRRELLARSLADWTAEDIDQFERLLSKFARSLESTTPSQEEPPV